MTHAVLISRIKKLKKRRPFVQVETIGHSVLRKPIYALSVGEGAAQIMYNAAHHANEYITSMLLMRFAEEYADYYAGLSGLTAGKTPTRWFIPMVNPDGVDLVTGAVKPGSREYACALSVYREKEPFPTGWKANIRGVDLNSNYPAGWETARRIKYERGYTAPGPREFVGTHPLSEPETVAMVNFTQSHNLGATVSLHTQGGEIYWRYADREPPFARETAKYFALVSGYECRDAQPEASHAGYKDWFIKEYNRPGFTIECGLGENPLPVAQFDKIYRETVGILSYNFT
ncbi:MAG: M14 family metallocarboxypeptidase [Clostridiales bacterium]|jgi:g-D-glutamyl-meso-diaminopimelate peptidase|nr:M14 family metallocarboxypeptidase [Clostridiales bacterium]